MNTKDVGAAALSHSPQQLRCRTKVSTPRHAGRTEQQRTSRLPAPNARTTMHTTTSHPQAHNARSPTMGQAAHAAAHATAAHDAARTLLPPPHVPTIRSRARQPRDATRSLTMMPAHQSSMSLASRLQSCSTPTSAWHGCTDRFCAGTARACTRPACRPSPPRARRQ